MATNQKSGILPQIDIETNELKKKYTTLLFETKSYTKFGDFPLSAKTIKGLTDAHFINVTEIQQESIGPALLGKDVVGAAATGSGKTLCFLIPVLEHLFVNKWSRTDGLGVIIISPTRELAYQIFETLRKIGKYHDFSAGLIIGGKNLHFEKNRMDKCNILICTPGRLLHHMNVNPLFNADSLEVLVLDEADRCLDMGFEQELNAIIENLPSQRQTLLFSASQNTDMQSLFRLNLKNPIYTGKNWKSIDTLVVPDLLQQNYIVVELEKKITFLWSFIKNHLKQKIIVFLSSCKQVKYIFEIFCKLRPGISLLALYGSLNQDRRINIYNDFSKKSFVVLFATDVASRGLDFPNVNWVLQLDCPENVTQYVHRAGRSARNKNPGESLLVLLPSEENAMINDLRKQEIFLRKIVVDDNKLFSPCSKIDALCAQNSELKATAQRAFLGYIKAIFLMKNKNVFNVHLLNLDTFAKSLGLVVTPRIRFLNRFQKKIQNKMLLNTNTMSSATITESSIISSDESDDEFLKIKRINHDVPQWNEMSSTEVPLPNLKNNKIITKAALAKKVIKKKLQINNKRHFDEKGQPVVDNRRERNSKCLANAEEADLCGINIDISKDILNKEDHFDKERFKELVKIRHRKLKRKFKEQNVPENESEKCYLKEVIDDISIYDLKRKNSNTDHKSFNSKSIKLNEFDECANKIKTNFTLSDTEAIATQLLSLH